MDRLESLIKKQGISKYRLAKDLNIAESTIRSWLKGISSPREKHIDLLASYFHVNAAWLRYGSPEFAPRESDEVQYLLKEAEALGVKEDGIAYIKYRIREAKKIKMSTCKATRKKEVSNE